MKQYPFQPPSLSERIKFVSMWIRKKSMRTIARETGFSPSTVHRWINRWKREGNVCILRPKRSNRHFWFQKSFLKKTIVPYPRIVLYPHWMQYRVLFCPPITLCLSGIAGKIVPSLSPKPVHVDTRMDINGLLDIYKNKDLHLYFH